MGCQVSKEGIQNWIDFGKKCWGFKKCQNMTFRVTYVVFYFKKHQMVFDICRVFHYFQENFFCIDLFWSMSHQYSQLLNPYSFTYSDFRVWETKKPIWVHKQVSMGPGSHVRVQVPMYGSRFKSTGPLLVFYLGPGSRVQVQVHEYGFWTLS